MDMAFLVQMRQCKKCGSVRNDEIITLYTWNMVQALQSASTASCKMPAPINDSIHPNNRGCSLGSRKKIWEMQDFLQQKFGRNKKFFEFLTKTKNIYWITFPISVLLIVFLRVSPNLYCFFDSSSRFLVREFTFFLKDSCNLYTTCIPSKSFLSRAAFRVALLANPFCQEQLSELHSSILKYSLR